MIVPGSLVKSKAVDVGYLFASYLASPGKPNPVCEFTFGIVIASISNKDETLCRIYDDIRRTLIFDSVAGTLGWCWSYHLIEVT